MENIVVTFKEPLVWVILLVWICVLLYMQKFYPLTRFWADTLKGDMAGGSYYYMIPLIIVGLIVSLLARYIVIN